MQKNVTYPTQKNGVPNPADCFSFSPFWKSFSVSPMVALAANLFRGGVSAQRLLPSPGSILLLLCRGLDLF